MGILDQLPPIPPPPRPDLHPLPGTAPLTPLAAALPPILYYLALILLPPFSENKSSRTQQIVQSFVVPCVRNALALLSAFLFFRLPLAYYVPFSVGLTYQLSLVGLYGGGRVVDCFFISYYFFNHIPRRVKYHHALRDDDDDEDEREKEEKDEEEEEEDEDADDNNGATISSLNHKKPHRSSSQSYFSLHFLRTAGLGSAVTETATTAPSPYPSSMLDRLSFALELELSMRGAGFTWTSADVRHTKRTWRPSVRDRIHSILVHVLPAGLLCWAVIRDVWVHYLSPASSSSSSGPAATPTTFDDLPLLTIQLPLTAALGGFLLCAFSLGYSIFAIVSHVLLLDTHFLPHDDPLVYFPPLYSVRVWEITSVRGFWAYGWHRLFSRLFLVYGVWPGQWLERTLLKRNHRKRTLLKSDDQHGDTNADADVDGDKDTDPDPDPEAEVGKILGGFLCSAFVHAFAGHAVLGGWQNGAGGEAVFFVENGVAVVLEEVVKRVVRRWRTIRENSEYHDHDHDVDDDGGGGKDTGTKIMLDRWYDGIAGRVWWISVLLFTGRNFARGWTRAGLVAEMSGG